MSYLIDTNIISELRKGERCDPSVAAWWSGVAEDDPVAQRAGAGRSPQGRGAGAAARSAEGDALEAWLGDVTAGFGDRVLPVDTAVAEEWGRMNAIRPVPVIDALLAATAKVNGLTLVTRNGADVAGLDVNVLNPFEPE